MHLLAALGQNSFKSCPKFKNMIFIHKEKKMKKVWASITGQTVTMVTNMKRNKLTAHRNSVITYYDDDELVSILL